MKMQLALALDDMVLCMCENASGHTWKIDDNGEIRPIRTGDTFHLPQEASDDLVRKGKELYGPDFTRYFKDDLYRNQKVEIGHHVFDRHGSVGMTFRFVHDADSTFRNADIFQAAGFEMEPPHIEPKSITEADLELLSERELVMRGMLEEGMPAEDVELYTGMVALGMRKYGIVFYRP